MLSSVRLAQYHKKRLAAARNVAVMIVKRSEMALYVMICIIGGAAMLLSYGIWWRAV